MRTIASVALAVCFSVALVHAQQSKPAAAPSPAPASGVTGTWTGSFKMISPDGQTRDSTAMMVLKQDGDAVTGTAGPDSTQQNAIAKGKIATTKEGTSLTFELPADNVTVQFELKLVDGHLKGNAKAERDGQKLNAEIDVVRAK